MMLLLTMLQGAKIAWREVPKIVAVCILLLFIGIGFGTIWLIVLSLLLLIWVCIFFRDPERTPDAEGAKIILAPADGQIRKIEVVEEPHFLKGQALRVTTFLSIFDVHVQRSPYAGEVALIHYQEGSFAPAYFNSADENEANLMGLQTALGSLAITQMTGILARRIVCWVSKGDVLEKGQRYGLIKFGSRVDLYLPLDAKVEVQVGQRVYGGQSVMAQFP